MEHCDPFGEETSARVPHQGKSPHKPGPSLGELSFTSTASSAPSFACATSRAIEAEEQARREKGQYHTHRVEEWVEGFSTGDFSDSDRANEVDDEDDTITQTPIASRDQNQHGHDRSTSPCTEKVERNSSKQQAPGEKVTSPSKYLFYPVSGNSPRPRSVTLDPKIVEKHIRVPTQQELDAPDSFAAILAQFPSPPGHRRIRSDLHVQTNSTQSQSTSQSQITPPNPQQTDNTAGPWSIEHPPPTPVKGRKLRRRVGIQL
jgi:hypothetical protein